VEAYRTEEEQVEALRRWWRENGRSTIVAIVVALGIGFGWQGWQRHQEGQLDGASDLYQRMLQAFSAPALSSEQQAIALQLAQQLKTEYADSTYAQFAGLQLARVAVGTNALAEAEAELRWVLGRADSGSDVARIAQLRLARVMAAAGQPDQALGILGDGAAGPYEASYAVARGDILLSLGREDEALVAYSAARSLAAPGEVDLVALAQKIQALNPVSVPGSAAAPDSAPLMESAADADAEG
jgi:predicted negative regulator of RcsB-dependent stress response